MSNQMSREIQQLFYSETHRGGNWQGSHREEIPKRIETPEQKEKRIAELMKRVRGKREDRSR